VKDALIDDYEKDLPTIAEQWAYYQEKRNASQPSENLKSRIKIQVDHLDTALVESRLQRLGSRHH
jgi:hypothetical protein